jgi:hypothetical protein
MYQNREVQKEKKKKVTKEEKMYGIKPKKVVSYENKLNILNK